MALVTISGRLATMSVMLRLNQPSSPSPVVTPVASRPASEEKPDLYCVMANMSSVKCAAGCANLNDSLLVCGQCFRCLILYRLDVTFKLRSAMTVFCEMWETAFVATLLTDNIGMLIMKVQNFFCVTSSVSQCPRRL